MGKNEQKTRVKNLTATIPCTDYGRLKTTGECGIFRFWGSLITKVS